MSRTHTVAVVIGSLRPLLTAARPQTDCIHDGVTTFTASQVGAALWRSSPDASLFSVRFLLIFCEYPAFCTAVRPRFSAYSSHRSVRHAAGLLEIWRPIQVPSRAIRPLPQLFVEAFRCIPVLALTLRYRRQARGRSLRAASHGMSCRSQPRFRLRSIGIIIPESVVMPAGARASSIARSAW